ncbi:MAG: VWA domain-containing protein [Clostridia bacterium]|nr:VWA domain-containing protein [Clostridia bacterium]
MKKNLTELVFILDKSGSMSGLESDTIGGFNSMLNKQKEIEGDAYVSTVLFDNRISVIHDRIDIKEVKPITEKEYFVGGCTALYDAIGISVDHISSVHKYAREEDVPEHTLFVITTDGMENASREYDIEKLRKLIKSKEELGWEFIFLGANIDSATVAEGIGIKKENAVNYCCDSKGTEAVYAGVSKAAGSLRKNKTIDACWCAEIKDDYSKRKR